METKSTPVDSTFLGEVENYFYFEDKLTDKLTVWAQDKCHTFIYKDPRRVEQPLQHSSIHEEFCDLFEELLTGFLTSQSVSINDFYTLLRKEQALAEKDGTELPVSATFGNVLLAVTDFFNFCEMMYDVQTGSEVMFCPPLIWVPTEKEDEEDVPSSSSPKKNLILVDNKAEGKGSSLSSPAAEKTFDKSSHK